MMRGLTRILCGLLGLAAAGCQSYSPYGYGYPSNYGYPGGYGAPTYAPPPGGMQPGGAPVYSPPINTGPATTTPPANSPPSSGQLQPFSGGTASQPEKLVPEYNDPNSPATLGQPQGDEFKPPVEKTPANPGQTSLDPPAEFETGAESGGVQTADATMFEEPQPFQPVSHEAPAAEQAADRPNPYAHDAQNYRWFRGIAEYDEQNKSWQVVYNPTPDEQDRFGGRITLADHPKLDVLNANDVVLVEGRVDEQQPDAAGQPKFAIEHAVRLTPKKAANPG